MSAVTAPRVFAPDGAPICRDAHPSEKSVYCDRPKQHDGGHLNKKHDTYWQAAQMAEVSA